VAAEVDIAGRGRDPARYFKSSVRQRAASRQIFHIKKGRGEGLFVSSIAAPRHASSLWRRAQPTLHEKAIVQRPLRSACAKEGRRGVPARSKEILPLFPS
jgi:hypothetical protein